MKSLATIIFCFFALILTAQSPFGHTANAEVMESDPVYLAKQTAKIKAGLSRNFHTDAGQEIVKTGGTQLWVQFADGTGEAMLLDFAQYGYTSLGHPVWSADGTQIAVSAKIGLNKADLIVLNADGSNARVLANFVQTWAVWMDLEDLSWRMDGQEIAGVLQVRENAWTDNGMFLFQHNLNTGETSYYTDYYCDGVSHAPNSSRLAYSLNTSLLDKNEVQVWNYADNTYETWEEDIRLEYGSHRRYSLISLTWSTESSILITIQLIDVFAADVYTYHVFRVEKIGENQFQTKFLFNTGAARPHLTSSPDGTTIYTSVVQNNKINMYQVYLQPNGDFIGAEFANYGQYPDWRRNIPSTENLVENNEIIEHANAQLDTNIIGFYNPFKTVAEYENEIVQEDANEVINNISNTDLSVASEATKMNKSNLEINVFPNPTVEVAIVTFADAAEQVQLQLFDAQGRVLQQWNNNIEAGQILSINVQQYPAGNYFLAGQFDGKMVQQTIVKR